WRFGYQAVGVFQIALAACFALTLARWTQSGPAPTSGSPGAAPEKRLTEYRTPMGATLRQPAAWLSVLLFFLYVGAEGGLGTWTYTLLTESRGIDPTVAGFFAGSYWFTFTIGRILAGVIARRVGGTALVLGGLIGALLGAGLLVWNPFELANVVAVGIIGISIAPIFPAMMSGTRARVGDQHAANTIGMQMTATGFGNAVIPSLMGVLASRISLEIIPLFLLAVYAGLFGLNLFAARLRPAPAEPAAAGLERVETAG
ncbi:MAG TPA: MFS transporter, partial [Herpetosiphonaceae bacterium]|nr:MFS transporter [Herpetosiphonaceae bacterium]